MATFSQVDFIESKRSWERAYFTTYALSLTFFESYLLPRLRKAGCERVTVFVDADGYRGSLMELRSRSIGQEYALIPIHSSTGIFHPKITYLWGTEGDLLLVGSGNLTFGGHGRNVECLEALAPDSDAAAFADFADFLELLRDNEALTIGDYGELVDLVRRVRNQAADLEQAGPTRLLHSLNTPILDQLIERAGEGGPWKELLCLSPYHHPAGKPVQKLAEGLGVKSLQVGVPSSPKTASSFPFKESRKWGLEVTTVAPRVSKPKRPLHAKWFELRGKQCLAMTGSANATHQSLATTQNVEVSILRQIIKKGTDSWKAAKEPQYVPNDFSAMGKSKDLVLHAVLAADGTIEGQILGANKLAEVWSVWLRIGEAHGAKETVRVDENGRFKWRPPDFNEFEAENAAQINLTKDQKRARGWVSFQSILKLPLRSRAAQAAIARMLTRDEALDDCRVLLDYIAFHSNKVLRTQTASKKDQSRDVENNTVDESFSVADLSLKKDRDSTGLLRDLANEALTNNRSWKTLSLIARLLAGRRLSGVTTGKKHGVRRAAPAQTDEEDLSESEATASALSLFNEQLHKEFSIAKGQNRTLIPLLVVWLNVNLDMRLRRLDDVAGAFTFSDQWMRRAINAPIPRDSREGLDESIYGVAAALALQVSTVTLDVSSVHAQALSAGLIHQWLETYLGGDVDESVACEQAQIWFQTATPNLLIGDETAAAMEALKSALRQPTPRMYLARADEAQRSGRSFELPSNIFSPADTQLVVELMKARLGYPRHKVVPKGAISCPTCHFHLHSSVQSALRARRITSCIQCKTTLVSVEP